MSAHLTTRRPRTFPSDARSTATLLWGAVLAGPVYVVVAGAQVVGREGFDLPRHAISLLANGSLGWIQIANFVVAGLLVLAGAAGFRRAFGGAGRGATWAPRLLGVYGVGLVASGIFVADPADGFPPGTASGMPAEVTWQGGLHLMAGGSAFAALIAACVVLARRFAHAGERAWVVLSAGAGGLLAIAFALVAAVPGFGGGNVLLTTAVVVTWAWLTAVAWRTRAGVREDAATVP